MAGETERPGKEEGQGVTVSPLRPFLPISRLLGSSSSPLHDHSYLVSIALYLACRLPELLSYFASADDAAALGFRGATFERSVVFPAPPGLERPACVAQNHWAEPTIRLPACLRPAFAR